MTDVEYPEPPFLFVDCYPFDFDDPHTAVLEDPPWTELLSDERVRGVVLKATDGSAWRYTEWFKRNYRRLRDLFGADRAVTRLIGGYSFLQLTQYPKPQAEFYLRTLHDAGWWPGDIVPIVDVEAGGPQHPNRRASAQQVIDCTTAFAEQVEAELGHGVMLYGRGLMRDLGIRSRMGCDRAWDPSYTRTIITHGLEAFTLDEIVMWQDIGDGEGDTTVTKLPKQIAGHAIDISVAIDGDRTPAWERTRARLNAAKLPSVP
jgi:GH25 family lysozyme M1 (1,4-beta-N-acetylmuramidase)